MIVFSGCLRRWPQLHGWVSGETSWISIDIFVYCLLIWLQKHSNSNLNLNETKLHKVNSLFTKVLLLSPSTEHTCGFAVWPTAKQDKSYKLFSTRKHLEEYNRATRTLAFNKQFKLYWNKSRMSSVSFIFNWRFIKKSLTLILKRKLIFCPSSKFILVLSIYFGWISNGK